MLGDGTVVFWRAIPIRVSMNSKTVPMSSPTGRLIAAVKQESCVFIRIHEASDECVSNAKVVAARGIGVQELAISLKNKDQE